MGGDPITPRRALWERIEDLLGWKPVVVDLAELLKDSAGVVPITGITESIGSELTPQDRRE